MGTGDQRTHLDALLVCCAPNDSLHQLHRRVFAHLSQTGHGNKLNLQTSLNDADDRRDISRNALSSQLTRDLFEPLVDCHRNRVLSIPP